MSDTNDSVYRRKHNVRYMYMTISLNTSAPKKGTAVVILCLIAVFMVNMHYKQYTTPEMFKRDDNLEVAQFGPNIWSGIPLLEWFDTFEREMAIFGNKGGMRLPHQFAVYTTLRILKPKVVIESGVWTFLFYLNLSLNLPLNVSLR